jgi:hypothetical protein
VRKPQARLSGCTVDAMLMVINANRMDTGTLDPVWSEISAMRTRHGCVFQIRSHPSSIFKSSGSVIVVEIAYFLMALSNKGAANTMVAAA